MLERECKEPLFNDLLCYLEETQKLLKIEIKDGKISPLHYKKALQFFQIPAAKIALYRNKDCSFFELLHPLERQKIKNFFNQLGLYKSEEINTSFLINKTTKSCLCLLQKTTPSTYLAYLIPTQKKLEKPLLERQKLMNLGALSTSVAHDMGNLQASMLCSTALLKKNDPSNKILDMLETSIQSAHEINQSILEYSRGSKKIFCQQPVEELKKYCEILQKTLKAGQSFHFFSKLDSKPLTINSSELIQILFNVFFNAKEAIAQSGDTISLHCSYHKEGPNEYFLMEICDNGCGIEEENIKKIFKDTFSTKSKDYQSGLGLSIVQEIVSSCGGWIDVQSQVNVTTSFKIYLPFSP